MARKSPHQLYTDIRENYKPQILALENRVSELEEELEVQNLENEASLDEIFHESNEDKKKLQSEIDNLKIQLKDKQSQLDKKELKKLAIEYEDQENDYQNDQDKWFWYVVAGFIALVISGTTSLILSLVFHIHDWTQKADFYFLNIAVITYLVFALRQYSSYKDLRVDYANRKTIAQSYFNILNSAEDEIIKQKYIDAAVDVLVSNVSINNQAHTIPEQLIENISEIAKNLSNRS